MPFARVYSYRIIQLPSAAGRVVFLLVCPVAATVRALLPRPTATGLRNRYFSWGCGSRPWLCRSRSWMCARCARRVLLAASPFAQLS